MNEQRRIDPRHTGTRRVFRIVGPVVLVAGLLCLIYGVSGMFGCGRRPGRPSRDFFADPHGYVDEQETQFDEAWGRAPFIFAGMPLTFLGLVMTGVGYAGAILRYQAAEVAPVARDAFNYMAEGTREGVREVASAVTEGVAEGLRQGPPSAAGGDVVQPTPCAACGAPNPADARHCSQCGRPIVRVKPCRACGRQNAPGARFCNGCGRPLA